MSLSNPLEAVCVTLRCAVPVPSPGPRKSHICYKTEKCSHSCTFTPRGM